MGQKGSRAKPKKKRGDSSSEAMQRKKLQSAPSAEDLRLAVVHLAEMAAAFEGRGIENRLGQGREASLHHFRLDHLIGVEEDVGGDLKVLAAVVQQLVRHRKDQRRKQRDMAIRELSEKLTHHARTYFADNTQTREELMRRIDASCRFVGVALDQPALDMLTPRSREDVVELSMDEEDEDAAPAWGCAEETMKHRLAGALGISARSIGTYRADNNPLKNARRTFGRWVPIKIWLKYVQEIATPQVATSPAEPVGVEQFTGYTEAFGLRLDRRLEDLLRRIAHDWDMLNAVQPEEVRSALRNMLEVRRVQLRAAVHDVLHGLLPLATLPAHLQAAVARLAPSVDASRGMDEVEAAIEAQARHDVMAQAARSLLPLIGEDP